MFKHISAALVALSLIAIAQPAAAAQFNQKSQLEKNKAAVLAAEKAKAEAKAKAEKAAAEAKAKAGL